MYSRRLVRYAVVAALLIAFGLLFTACTDTEEPTATPQPTEPAVVAADPTDIPKPEPSPTIVLTDTPAATATQEPTNTPAPTATPTPVPLMINVGRDYVSSSGNYYHVVGEIVNESEQWYDFVRIVGSFYDEEGALIGTDFTYIELETLPPNDVGVFDLSINIQEIGRDIDSYELHVEYDVTTPSYQDIEANVSNEYFSSSGNYYHLVGEARNTGTTDCEFVKIVGALYDADETVLSVDFTYTELDIVPAGGASPFDLSLDVSAGIADAIASYRYWVQCDPISSARAGDSGANVTGNDSEMDDLDELDTSLDLDLGEGIERGYLTILLLQGSSAILEETALAVQHGDIGEFEVLGVIIGLGSIMEVADESLADSSPAPIFDDTWEDLRQARGTIGDVASQWLDGEITSSDVPQLLVSADDTLETAIGEVERQLAAEQGIAEEELRYEREAWIDELRSVVTE